MMNVRAFVSLLLLGGGCALLAGCDTEEKAPPTRSVTQAQVTNELVLRYPAGSDGSVPIVAFEGKADIRDRARLELPNGDPVGLAQLGGQGVEIGASARVGSIDAEGNVFLRSHSTVSGDVTTAGSISKQNDTTVTGTENSGTAATPFNEEVLDIPVFSVSGNDVHLEPEQTRTLAPGQYSHLNVKSRSTLNLSAGDYAFKSVTIEPDAVLHIDDGVGPVRLYVDNGMTFRASVKTPNGEPPALLVVQVGANQVMLDATFHGTVIAPAADLILGPGNQPHEGAFMGKTVTVRPDTKVVYRPYFRLVGEPAFQLPADEEFGRYGIVRARADGSLLVEGPQGPLTVDGTGNVDGPFTTPEGVVVLGDQGDYYAHNAPEMLRVYDATGSLQYERPRQPGSHGRLVPGSSVAFLPEVVGDPENLTTTHGRFYDASGLLTRFPVPGLKVSRLTEDHLIYTTETDLKKVTLDGTEVWSVPLDIRRFVVSKDGSRLLGVVDTRERGEVMHVDLSDGSVISSTALEAEFWNMAISSNGTQSVVSSRHRLYVFADGQVRKELALPFKWAASVAISDDGKALVGGQFSDHRGALLLTGPPGAGASVTELPQESAGYRPDVEFLDGGKRFSSNKTEGLTVYDVVRSK